MADRTTETERWRLDPSAYFREALGLEPWSRQRDILNAVRDHDRIAVRSGHKVSKSTSAAGIALWWAHTRPKGGVILTAPTGRQVKRIVWRELRRLAATARERGVDIPEPPLDPGTGLQWDDGRFIFGFSTDNTENMGGYSGAELLFIVDEASGVAEEIFEAIEGNRAGGARLLCLGNPTQPAGTFADAFGRHRAGWHTLHVSSEESPNVTGEAAIPGLATRDWVEEKRRDWGEDSPLFQVRVRGNFADASDACVIPLGLIERAIDRWDAEDVERARTSADDARRLGPLNLGVDVARFGDDDSVSCAVRGDHVLELVARNGFAEEAVAGLVLAQARAWRHRGEPPPRAKIDTTGGSGLGVASILHQAPDLVEVVEVSASERANAEDEYPNRRSELWFATQLWLREGGAIPDDERLCGDLVAPHYGFDARGRRQVEKKEDFKRRLKRSPDRADALALAVYAPWSQPLGAKFGSPQTRWGAAAGRTRGFG